MVYSSFYQLTLFQTLSPNLIIIFFLEYKCPTRDIIVHWLMGLYFYPVLPCSDWFYLYYYNYLSFSGNMQVIQISGIR